MARTATAEIFDPTPEGARRFERPGFNTRTI
jgi:hypothetical protein